MNRRIYVIGNFGYYSNDLNGQTMRTRTVFESLKKYMYKVKYDIKYKDTSIKNTSLKGLISNFKDLYNIFVSEKIILMPAYRAIKFLTPFFYYISLILRKDIHFIAIGGWLAEFLENNESYIKYFRIMKNIYVQTESLKISLENKFNLENVVYFPNFRSYEPRGLKISGIKEVNRIVFFSRVIKEKGIELAIKATNEVNKRFNTNIELHIYGPIGEDYKDQFKSIMRSYSNIYYKGVLEPDHILSELSKYDFMIFPTYYKGEGFPGAILDGLTAGVPVVCTDWKYNSEIIKNGYTGLLFENKSIEDLIRKMETLIKDTKLINKMKQNCISESNKYSETNVIEILLEKLK